MRTFDLEPEESWSHTESLLYSVDPRGLVLATPGTYSFIAKLYFESGGEEMWIESNTIEVGVRSAPQGARALTAWMDPDLLEFVQGSWGLVSNEKVERGLRKADQFVRKYGESVYAHEAVRSLRAYFKDTQRRRALSDEEREILNYVENREASSQ